MPRFSYKKPVPNKKYMSFMLGTLLAISESLPLCENIKSNGILHMIKSINDEYRKL